MGKGDSERQVKEARPAENDVPGVGKKDELNPISSSRQRRASAGFTHTADKQRLFSQNPECGLIAQQPDAVVARRPGCAKRRTDFFTTKQYNTLVQFLRT